jgi:2-haloacid dehalogenase
VAVTYNAICCDLLTALVDSWSLWEAAAGNSELGTRWRQASLRIVTGAGRYRPYEPVVTEAAREAGVPEARAQLVLDGWAALEPYPDVRPALGSLALPIVVVTNTSQLLAEAAARRLGVPLHAVVSAEAAGWYKPHPLAYQKGWEAAGAASASQCLFVAGSPHDAAGATRAGHDVYWVNRRGAALPEGGPAPRWEESTLAGLGRVLAEPE